MHRKLFVVVILMAVALVVNVSAQNKARADVPFDFIVGDKVLPAATYDISEINSQALAIRNAGNGAMVLFQPADGKQHMQSKMVFHKYGDRYFLYQIWNADSVGLQVRKSKLEKEQALADNQASAPQEVVVALR
jgi:hypothetical protein